MDATDVAAIVTGGASGLGGATVRRLAADGAHVIAIDLPKAIDHAEKLERVDYVPADVTDGDQVQAAVDAAVGTGLPLRVVVNCAGVGTAGRVLSKKGPHDLGVFSQVVGVNLIGSFNVMRLAAAAIAQTEPLDHNARGVIVNTASIAAFEGQIGQIAYAASKGGVVGMTVPAARDLAQYGVRVLTIAPGVIDTPMLAGVEESFRADLAKGVPFPQRLGDPTEYAKLVAMIVDHDYLNGEVIRMDGALRMSPR
ncbi:SDR family NAD(P)-dependent oxidoreductase [Actinomycetospora corticicola]|uniref:NAD(P)-dependent dehydrogenase (Short-subunit alcohol dehydrogenase family) n=1 Tax=Actinomycetospora corticicola TaxID=663602 RepID=A0A7Y9DZV5_9PSEU|nr:SDR family NAD(P)-dependent oxidoreductase [Actinomycetospora corticicola]NYD38416.1 NAD(P)-dependent dehydrogenase (short-subunit alcohol dehydrogenase family) [Actinomycetospora corticicola]